MSEAVVIALLGALAAIVTAVYAGVVAARNATAYLLRAKSIVRQSEVDRLQDVIDFYHLELTGLMKRVTVLEAKSVQDAEEKTRLQKRIHDLECELATERRDRRKEREEWGKEKKLLEDRITELERILAHARQEQSG